MNDEMIRPADAQKLTILMLTLGISVVFIALVSDSLIALFLGAVFSALAYPLFKKVTSWLGGRKGPAAVLTLVILILIVLIPALILLDLIAVQAYDLTQDAMPWLEKQLKNPEALSITIPDWVPFRDKIDSSGPQIAAKLGELAGKVGGYLVSALSAATTGAAGFFLDLFIMLYAMFFFLRSGPPLVEKLMTYPPLSPEIQNRLIEMELSVARATIKGTVVIGLVQGALGGIGFWAVGIQGAAFWAATMAVASVIPSVGTALVWVPAVAYLLITGQGRGRHRPAVVVRHSGRRHRQYSAPDPGRRRHRDPGYPHPHQHLRRSGDVRLPRSPHRAGDCLALRHGVGHLLRNIPRPGRGRGGAGRGAGGHRLTRG